MKKSIMIYLICAVMNAQQKYPVAPEIWSTPEEIKVITKFSYSKEDGFGYGFGHLDGLEISPDGKTLYFAADGIFTTTLSDTGWTKPNRLGGQINRDPYVATPALTPSGKRLFYTWLVGDNWFLFYSDWDEKTKDWGEANYAGPEINIPYGIGSITAPNDTTIIFGRHDPIYIAYYQPETKSFGKVTGFPNNYLQGFANHGYRPLMDFSKIYYTLQQRDTTLEGKYYLKEDLTVKYRRNDVPELDYARSYVLNISYQADTLYFKRKYKNRWNGWPTPTRNGKVLYFAADYYDMQTVFVSHMLVDEKGNPVSVKSTDRAAPSDFKLYTPYPNPFNSSTVVEYELDKQSKIQIEVYDTLGRKVKVLFSGEKQSGKYNLIFSSENLSSGVYLIVLKTPNGYTVQKTNLLK